MYVLVCSRFLINISEEDRKDVFKLCSQVELAHWFYLDLVRPEDHSLPACSFKEFMATSILTIQVLLLLSHYCSGYNVPHRNSDALPPPLTHAYLTHTHTHPLVPHNPYLHTVVILDSYPSISSLSLPSGPLNEQEPGFSYNPMEGTQVQEASERRHNSQQRPNKGTLVCIQTQSEVKDLVCLEHFWVLEL